jgi:hypothetical protein
LLHNSEIRFLMIGLCFHITKFESIFHRLELNVAYNYEKIELCNKADLSLFVKIDILSLFVAKSINLYSCASLLSNFDHFDNLF